MVMSEKSKSNETDKKPPRENVVTSSQKKLLNPKFRTRSGYEVCLSFRYKTGTLYSLRAHGPTSGGRVSVSNTRIQQVRVFK